VSACKVGFSGPPHQRGGSKKFVDGASNAIAMSARDWDHAHLAQSYHVAKLRSALRVLVHNARDRIGLSDSEMQRVLTRAASGKESAKQR